MTMMMRKKKMTKMGHQMQHLRKWLQKKGRGFGGVGFGMFSKAIAGAATSRDTTKDLLAQAEKREKYGMNPQTRVVHVDRRKDREKGTDREGVGEKRKRDDNVGEEDRPGFFKTKTRPVIYWKPATAEQVKRNERYFGVTATTEPVKRSERYSEPTEPVKRSERYSETVCRYFRDTGRCRNGSRCRYEHVRNEKRRAEGKIDGREAKTSSRGTRDEKRSPEDKIDGREAKTSSRDTRDEKQAPEDKIDGRDGEKSTDSTHPEERTPEKAVPEKQEVRDEN